MLIKIIVIVITCILSSMQSVTRMRAIVGLKSSPPNLNITRAAPDNTTTSGCNVHEDGEHERGALKTMIKFLNTKALHATLKPKHISVKRCIRG